MDNVLKDHMGLRLWKYAHKITQLSDTIDKEEGTPVWKRAIQDRDIITAKLDGYCDAIDDMLNRTHGRTCKKFYNILHIGFGHKEFIERIFEED